MHIWLVATDVSEIEVIIRQVTSEKDQRILLTEVESKVKIDLTSFRNLNETKLWVYKNLILLNQRIASSFVPFFLLPVIDIMAIKYLVRCVYGGIWKYHNESLESKLLCYKAAPQRSSRYKPMLYSLSLF